MRRRMLMNEKQVGGLLPSTYQQVEYIQSTGTQYIDTSVNYTYDTKIETSIQAISGSGNICGVYKNGLWSFGIRIGKDGFYEGVWLINRNLGDLNAIDLLKSNVQGELKANISFDKTGFTVNGETISPSKQQQDFGDTRSIGIFTMLELYGGVNTTNSNPVKLYSFKIYNNDLIVRNFIPCFRKIDSIVGLYDTVNNEFYTNAGTGEFIAGENV